MSDARSGWYDTRDPLVEELQALGKRVDKLAARFDGLTTLLRLLLLDDAHFDPESEALDDLQ